jgi:hypothetical protein
MGIKKPLSIMNSGYLLKPLIAFACISVLQQNQQQL